MANERIMSDAQRALQLWPLLVFAARTNSVLSYDTVQEMTGLVRQNPNALGHIAFYCMKKRLPLLSSLVVNQKSGNPESEFYDGMDIAAEHRRCFVHDWLAAGKRPELEELEQFWQVREDIKKDYLAERKRAAGAAVGAAV